MDIQRIFAPLRRLESALCDLYSWYSERFAQDAEAALIFKRLSLDEKAHAALLDYQRKLVRMNPKEFGEVDVDLDEVESMTFRVEAMRKYDCPDVASAIRVALGFEFSAAEFHYRNAIKQAKPSIVRLLDSLGKSDRRHLEDLRDFARSRNYVDS